MNNLEKERLNFQSLRERFHSKKAERVLTDAFGNKAR